MPWSRFDDQFHDNAKILSPSHAAFRLYVCAVTYCRGHEREDRRGWLTVPQAHALARQQDVPIEAIDELLEKRAWHADAGDFRIHDFEVYNPPDPTVRSAMRRAWEAISWRLRPVIFARDGYQCLWCGSRDRLEIDHIESIHRGGTNEESNLRTLCLPCNRRKGAR